MIDAQNLFCTSIVGDPAPEENQSIEKGGKSREEILIAARDSFRYCDPLYETVSDSDLADGISLRGQNQTRAFPLILNLYHLSRHYGNIAAYLRLKGITPPSTQR